MRLFSRKQVILAALAFCGLGLGFTSCMSDDITSTSNTDKISDELKTPSEYFDFSTKQEVKVNVDFKSATQPVHVSVYTANPYNEAGELDATLKPIFSAYTSEGGKFEATVTAPSTVKRLYISTLAVGYPLVINESVDDSNKAGLPIVNGAITWSAIDASELSNILPLVGANATRVEFDEVNIGSNVSTLVDGSLYALYNSYYNNTYVVNNSSVQGLYSQYYDDYQLTPESTLGELSDRLSNTLYRNNGTKKDNSSLIRKSDVVNLEIMNTTSEGKKVASAQVDLVFLNAAGTYHNSMAYYYYPSDKVMTEADLHALPKFLIFPRTTNGRPSVKMSARLQYFGANYDESGVDAFPPGYTIGWMLISNVYFGNSNTVGAINSVITNYATGGNCIYSNEIANGTGNSTTGKYSGQPLPGCISLFDYKSQTVVIGFEDQAYRGSWGDKSFDDILFFAACTPAEAIESISKVNEIIEGGGTGGGTGDDEETLFFTEDIDIKPVWNTYTEEGTLAFEDMWPEEGDYDMNDMVLEYKTTVSYNQWNQVRWIEDEFTPIHNGAVYKNAFGVTINEDMGTVDAEASSYAVKEDANRFIMWTNNKDALESGETFKVVRKWAEDNYLEKADRQTRSVNPFLVINYSSSNRNRSEVHLPKSTPTAWANTSLNNTASDAYYVNRDGGFPFAIELYGVTGWALNEMESRRIDHAQAYPRFASWAASKGTQDSDWYE